MNRLVLTLFFMLGCVGSSVYAQDEPRDYWAPLTAEEEQNIYYVIHTLGTTPTISLGWHQKELEEAGRASGHVHPMRYMRFVYTHPELSKDIQTIGYIPWKRFSKDFGESFSQEAAVGNLGQPIQHDFCDATNLDKHFFEPFFVSNDWYAMMNALRETLGGG